MGTLKTDSIVDNKSLSFALRIIKACDYLTKIQKEFVISKQILKSGTAIGALVREAEFAESKSDFIHKLYIALKEANETEYWLILLKEAHYISEPAFDSMVSDCKELIKLLVSNINSTKRNMNMNKKE